MSLRLEDLILFYRDVFIPVYSDTVGYIADKPIQIIVEIENAFAHIMVYLDDANSPKIKEDNLKKAYNHLLRASMDCYKILWVKMSDDIDKIAKDEYKRKFVVNMPEHLFLKKWATFKENAKKARNKEINKIGQNDTIEVVESYKEAVAAGWDMLKSIDIDKINTYRRFSIINFIKQQWIGIITGIIASAVVAYAIHLINKFS